MTITKYEDAPLTPADIAVLEKVFLSENQADCPVINHFGAGVWIREVTIPAGVFAIGHEQRYAQMNIVLRGSVAMYKNGRVEVVKAPAIFVGAPGRKIGFVLEEVTWLNVFPTDSTDSAELEEQFFIKSDDFKAHQEADFLVKWAERESDRQDFLKILAQVGIDPITVRAQSEDPKDLIPTPPPWDSFTKIDRSPIEGKGLFSLIDINEGEMIVPSLLGGMRTVASRFTNHSKKPTARIEVTPNGDVYLIALRKISGQKGGMIGEEITIDYRTVFARRGLVEEN